MANRIHHDVKTTKDRVTTHAFRVRVAGNMSGSIVTSTFGSGSATLSGTSPGLLTVTLPASEKYPQLMGYSQPALTSPTAPTTAGISGSSAIDDVESYGSVRLVRADSSTGIYEFQCLSGSGIGTKTPFSPNATSEISFQFTVRNTDRSE